MMIKKRFKNKLLEYNIHLHDSYSNDNSKWSQSL